MKYDEYEERVKQIGLDLASIVEDLTPIRTGSGRKNRIVGQSGYFHQIDVSIEYQSSLILVECKRWESKCPPTTVLSFKSRIEDIKKTYPSSVTIHPVIVSFAGITSGAIKLANYYGIDHRIINDRNIDFWYKDLGIAKTSQSAYTEGK